MTETLTSKELESECLKLQRHGLRYPDIAAKLSITPKKVSTLLRRANARRMAVDDAFISTQRAIVLDRLDEMINSVYEQAIGAEPRIITMADGTEVIVKKPDLLAQRLIKDLDKERRDLLGLDLSSKKEDGGNKVSVVVSYITEDKIGAGSSAHAAVVSGNNPPISVSYSEVKCLPEPSPQK